MPNFFRNVDDNYSDPTVIETQYKIGRNAYFEVQLTLDELNDKIVGNTGGLKGSPDVIAVESGGYEPPRCPYIDEYVWVGKSGENPKPMKAKSLIKRVGSIALYNPLTGKFNLLKSAVIVKDQPLFNTNTFDGVGGLSSMSHKIIRNTADKFGISLRDYVVGGEVTRFEHSSRNLFIDTLIEMSHAGTGDVVEIELASEYIYVSGSTKSGGLLAHNRKISE